MSFIIGLTVACCCLGSVQTADYRLFEHVNYILLIVKQTETSRREIFIIFKGFLIKHNYTFFLASN